MKKVIALCLALVLVLSVAGLCLAGSIRCGRCGKTHAGIIDSSISYSTVNSSVHKVIRSYQIYCPDCLQCYWTTQTSNEPHRNLTHYTQTISLHLMYEYDVCGICGARINAYTHSY